MVTGKIIKTEFNYPVLSVFVSFSDDQDKLSQPQVQQLSFSGETLMTLNKETLQLKIQEYIDLYETSLAKAESIQTEINKEFNISGEIVKMEEIK